MGEVFVIPISLLRATSFTVSFDNMTNLLVTGVWNETMKRVEF